MPSGWRIGLAGLCALGLVACAVGTGAPAPDLRRSGFDGMGASTQAMQRDDLQNPAMLWVQDGAALWQRKSGRNAVACADCHGDAVSSMRGVAARYPAWDADSGRALVLGQRINQCVSQRQQAPVLAAESPELLSLETYVGLQSRGLPLAPAQDTRLTAPLQRGAALFAQRMGQLDLSCAQCHDERAGQRLGGSVIPQGHATGYPIYRLEWQGMGSLQRRIRNCLTGVRAEPFAYGAPEMVALELYLAQRARGMVVETPAVRP